MTSVTLHIYDVTGSDGLTKLNNHLKAIGTGAFHGAVEVYGVEWSFGAGDDRDENGNVMTGIFDCAPKGCEPHKYRESHPMGTTQMSKAQVDALLKRMEPEWPGTSYDLLRRNCCTFSDTFCQELGVGPIPTWVNNLAGAGATLHDGAKGVLSAAQLAAIIAAAKAGEIDQKYQVSARVDAGVKTVLAHAQKLDQEHGISTKAADAATKAGEKAAEIDKKYDISGKAAKAAGDGVAALSGLFSKLGSGGSSGGYGGNAK
eukprot:TRINITY_DN87524_c0_g1_i1.p1 TRINITY_DN87524_c0_g1~~TRINITY_DN87524_c0_g1_i1.p1  ORF type:complete len:270 (+),score=52.80 TRINITY_DN87524_c0_g1_i1:35-811(+)